MRHAIRKLPAWDATNVKRAVWPDRSPSVGEGVLAPRKAGVIVSGPRTIAQECRMEAAFRQMTVTRQPTGILTSSSPRP